MRPTFTVLETANLPLAESRNTALSKTSLLANHANRGAVTRRLGTILRLDSDSHLGIGELSDSVHVEIDIALRAVNNVGRSSAREVVLRFCVSDTGMGIASDRLDRIFDEYAQASAEISSLYGGKGLGLAISRRIVELCGGTLRVDSELGVGTTFSFVLCLPVADDDPTRRPDISNPA
jgi:signal transduction histidine kinase